jgi:hypothetical protein
MKFKIGDYVEIKSGRDVYKIILEKPWYENVWRITKLPNSTNYNRFEIQDIYSKKRYVYWEDPKNTMKIIELSPMLKALCG